MLSKSAFNALLKTLEEPPEHVKFIFSTTEPERLPATILSRCQRFDFRAVPTERIAEHLADICKREKVKAEPEAVQAVAREGRGSVRDALTLLDQVIAVGDGKVTLAAVRDTVGAVSGEKVLEVLAAGAAGDAGKALALFNDLLAAGADLQALLEQLMREVRDLLVVKTCGPQVPLLDVFGPPRADLETVAARLSTPALVAAMGYLAEARNRARYVVDARPIGELALVRLASLAEMEPLPEVLARLEAITQAMEPGAKRAAATVTKDMLPGRMQPATPPRGPSAPPDDDKKKRTVAPPSAAADEQQAGHEPSAPPPLVGRTAEAAAADPVIQKAVRLFDGRIISGGE